MTPLRRRMTQDMQLRNLAPNTQQSYVENVARFAGYVNRSPNLLGPEQIRSYLLDHALSASSARAASPSRWPRCGSCTASPWGATGTRTSSFPPPSSPTSCRSSLPERRSPPFWAASTHSATAPSSRPAMPPACASPRRSACALPTLTASAWSCSSAKARAPRTARPCSRRACSRSSAATGPPPAGPALALPGPNAAPAPVLPRRLRSLQASLGTRLAGLADRVSYIEGHLRISGTPSSGRRENEVHALPLERGVTPAWRSDSSEPHPRSWPAPCCAPSSRRRSRASGSTSGREASRLRRRLLPGDRGFRSVCQAIDVIPLARARAGATFRVAG